MISIFVVLWLVVLLIVGYQSKVDLKTGFVPYKWTKVIIVLGLTAHLIESIQEMSIIPILRSLVMGIIGYYWFLYVFTMGKQQLGGGDIKLLAAFCFAFPSLESFPYAFFGTNFVVTPVFIQFTMNLVFLLPALVYSDAIIFAITERTQIRYLLASIVLFITTILYFIFLPFGSGSTYKYFGMWGIAAAMYLLSIHLHQRRVFADAAFIEQLDADAVMVPIPYLNEPTGFERLFLRIFHPDWFSDEYENFWVANAPALIVLSIALALGYWMNLLGMFSLVIVVLLCLLAFRTAHQTVRKMVDAHVDMQDDDDNDVSSITEMKTLSRTVSLKQNLVKRDDAVIGVNRKNMEKGDVILVKKGMGITPQNIDEFKKMTGGILVEVGIRRTYYLWVLILLLPLGNIMTGLYTFLNV